MSVTNNPFKGLLSYAESDEAEFIGREKEISELLAHIKANDILILYGKSGVGKTSIIRAGIVPQLRIINFLPIYIRIDFFSKIYPSDQVDNTIKYISHSSHERKTEVDGISNIKESVLVENDAQHVLILDQFEETFTIANREYQYSLIDRISFVIRENETSGHRKIKVIICLREEYLPELEELTVTIPELSRIRYRLKASLRRDDLIKLIMRPGGIEPEVANSLLSKFSNKSQAWDMNGSTESIDFSMLQIILHTLYRDGVLQDQFKAHEYFNQPNSLESIFKDYVSSTMTSVESKHLKTLSKYLIPGNYRAQVPSRELYDAIPKTVIDDLLSSRVLRTFFRDSHQWIELSHDLFVNPIKQLVEVIKVGPGSDSDIKDLSTSRLDRKYKYDVAITFAGEDRNVTKEIAIALRKSGVEVFFDEFRRTDMFGKNLIDYLSKVYRDDSNFCLMMISKHYVQKKWTSIERQSAQARALSQLVEYILPVRIDDTEVPGLPDTVGYIHLAEIPSSQLVKIIVGKLTNSSLEE